MNKMIAGVKFNNIENGKILRPHALMCAHALGDTPIPSRWYERYTTRKENDHNVLHNAVVMTTTSNGCPT